MKILYYYSKLNIGGAEKSTVRLLNQLIKCGHDVTLLLRWNGGSLEKELSKKIDVIYLKKFKSDDVSIISYVFETIKMYFRVSTLAKKEYDIAISGLFGYNPKILFENIRARQYYQMLRNDVKATGQYGNTSQYMKKYGAKFDAYIGVSEYTTNSFRDCYQDLKDRAYTVYNVLPDIDYNKTYDVPKEIKKDDCRIKILTLCRIVDSAKAVFRMVDVCKILNREYPDKFVWYVVGEGTDKEELKKRVIDKKLQNVMILCEQTANPLPYYANCDLVAVLSYHEGLCGVVNEAKLMHRPLIATRFSGIDEQIINGKNGVIVENSVDGILSGFRRLFDNRDFMESLAVNGMPGKLLDNDYKANRLVEIFENIEETKNG